LSKKGELATPQLLMMHPDDIHKKLVDALEGAQVDVQDLTGTLDHFRVTVTASQFEGKTMVEQHRMIYEIMNEAMEANGGGIHALSLSTHAPE
jgi:stress-induced morphogen